MTENLEEIGGISRRTALKRVWVVRSRGLVSTDRAEFRLSASASHAPSTCDGVTLNNPCNVAIPCQGLDSCNCWVLMDRSGCYCGPFGIITTCASNSDCPAGEVCVDNCAGGVCKPPCGASHAAGNAEPNVTERRGSSTLHVWLAPALVGANQAEASRWSLSDAGDPARSAARDEYVATDRRGQVRPRVSSHRWGSDTGRGPFV